MILRAVRELAASDPRRISHPQGLPRLDRGDDYDGDYDSSGVTFC